MGAFTYASALLIAIGVPSTHASSIDASLSRDIFQSAAAAGHLSGQNFDSSAPGATLRTLDGVTFSASQGSVVVTRAFLATTPPNGLGSTPSGFFAANESATISFATAITAFAIDINTFAPDPGDYVAELDTGATVPSRLVYFGGSSFGQFLGFTSDTPFTSVTIRAAAQAGFPYTMDTLIFGDALSVRTTVPEPSTWPLLTSGLFLLFWRVTARGRPSRGSSPGNAGAAAPTARDHASSAQLQQKVIV